MQESESSTKWILILKLILFDLFIGNFFIGNTTIDCDVSGSARDFVLLLNKIIHGLFNY